jgi:hypothetical protein
MLEATEAKHFRPTQAGPELVLGVAEGVQKCYSTSLLCGGPGTCCRLFSEGFDTRDLPGAQALVAELC